MKIVKFLALSALSSIAALSASAETRSMTIPAGHSEAVELGFVPRGRRIIGKELVTVSMRDGSTSAVINAGDAQGSCQVEFIDAGGGEGLLLGVEVVGDLDDTLRALRKWLADFDNLEFVKGKSRIAVTGTISNPSDWAKFEKICALSDFRDKIEKVVEFSVDPATIRALREQLVAEGVPLCPEGERPGDGQIAMEYAHNVLNFTGTAFSKGDIDNLVRVLKGRSWLEVVSEPKGASTSTVAQAVVSVGLDDSLLELGVAFVAVSEKASHDMGSKTGIDLNGIWNGFYDFLTGRHRSAETFRIDASLNSTLTMLAENGVSRERQYGTIRFHANGDPGKELHLGGTLKVTPPASGEGEAPDAQDYDYGFRVTNRNSRRTGPDEAEADVEIEINGYPYFQNVNGAVTVDQQKRPVSPSVRVPLGKTVAIAGYEALVEQTKPASGVPILRHVPILKWFVAQEGESLEDQTLLFLVSVRKVDSENEEPMVPNTPMKDITLDASTPNAQRIADGRVISLTRSRRWWWPPDWFNW